MIDPRVPDAKLTASFRDPHGFVFKHDGEIYRQLNDSCRDNYDGFMQSGLYEVLVEKRFLVPHVEIDDGLLPGGKTYYKILKPEQLQFISYPYEWSFSQLKDAALQTLRVQALSLEHGFVLKDASAYNVQFVDSHPIFIDTLSFVPYADGVPWVAYRQFCQHFLAPLALMAYSDIGLSKLLVTNIDGIPLELASKLLPVRTKFNYSLLAHIHLHARMQKNYADAGEKSHHKPPKATKLSLPALKALVASLHKATSGLKWNIPKTEWGNYYENTNYSERATASKKLLVDEFLSAIPESLNVIHDLGANSGDYSRVAATHCNVVVSQDIDPVAVEENYLRTGRGKPRNILPLIQDLFAPSPAIGWANTERDSFVDRGQCDAILALALIHHIAISNNVPIGDIARLFARLTRWLIIEFVPKSDSQVERLLRTREDIFPNYHEKGFERAFSSEFTVIDKRTIDYSDRTLFLMKRNASVV